MRVGRRPACERPEDHCKPLPLVSQERRPDETNPVSRVEMSRVLQNESTPSFWNTLNPLHSIYSAARRGAVGTIWRVSGLRVSRFSWCQVTVMELPPGLWCFKTTVTM